MGCNERRPQIEQKGWSLFQLPGLASFFQNRKIRNESRVNVDANEKEMTLIGRVIGLPWWLGKKFPEWYRAMGIEMKRDETRHTKNVLFHKSVKNKDQLGNGVKDMHEFIALPKKEQEEMFPVLLESDAQNKAFSDKDLKKGIFLKEMGKQHSKFRGKTISLNERQIEAYRAWDLRMKEALEHLLETGEKITYMPYENKTWIKQLKINVKERATSIESRVNNIREREDLSENQKEAQITKLLDKEKQEVPVPDGLEKQDAVDFKTAFRKLVKPQSELNQLRNSFGEVKFYVPRIREDGEFVVRIFQGKGDDRLLRWSSRHTSGAKAQIEGEKQLRRLEQEEGLVVDKNLFAEDVKKEPRLPEAIFQNIDIPAVETFLKEAIERAKDNQFTSITSEQVDAVRDELLRAVAIEFKSRGFGGALIARRKGPIIGGYTVENGAKIFTSYITGLTGYTSKQIAAFEYNELLSSIDVKKNPKIYSDIAQYGKDMLRNEGQLERVLGRFRAGAFIYYLAGNLRAPALNITQNFILGIPTLASAKNPATGKRYIKNPIGAETTYLKALKDVATKKFSTVEQRMSVEAAEKGITGDQLTKEAMDKTRAEVSSYFNTVSDFLSYPFRMTEIYNRKSAMLAMFRTSHNAKIKAGMDKEQAYEEAFEESRNYVLDVHFLYGKQNLPSFARGGEPSQAVARTALTFRSFTLNYLSAMHNILSNRDFDVFARSLTYIALLGGLSALPFLDDWLDFIEDQTGKTYRKDVKDGMKGIGGEVLSTVGIQGLPALIGIDLSGSLRIHFPRLDEPGKQIEESIFGVWEGLALKAVRATKLVASGEYLRAFETATPQFIANPLTAARLSGENLTTQKGHTILTPEGTAVKLSSGEVILKGLGFNPAETSRLSMDFRLFKNFDTFFRNRRSVLFDKARFAKTADDFRKLNADIVQYNKDASVHKGAIPLISRRSINTARREKSTKRFAAFTNL